MSARQPKPWPLKWVFVAIIVMIVPYTILTLKYRKPGPSYMPYEDTRNRINNSRLLSAGFQRITLDAHRLAEPAKFIPSPGNAATAELALGGLPTELSDSLIENPILPISIDKISASAVVAASADYPIQFTCALADNKQQLSDAHLYRLEQKLFLVASFEKLDGELMSRTPESTVMLTVPGTTLKPGTYNVTVVGQRTSRHWTLQVH